MAILSTSLQWRGQGSGGSVPLKKENPAKKTFKNLKTLKGGSLFVSVNSEPTVA